MSAMPYLIQRLARWWALQSLQVRAQQLAGLIRQIEQNMDADAGEHAALRFELRRVNARLVAAQQHQRSRGAAW